MTDANPITPIQIFIKGKFPKILSKWKILIKDEKHNSVGKN